MLTQNQPLNYYLEVTAHQECAGLDRYGVMVRSDSETGTCSGLPAMGATPSAGGTAHA
jgi:hypothetical protein